MLYKERLGGVQYIPLKRSRFGIKYLMLCESTTGYVWSFVIFVGKRTQFNQEYNELPKSSQVVMTLLKPLLNQGYCVTIDNYYTSPELADLLVINKTHCHGTVKSNRKGLPPAWKTTMMRKGEISAYRKQQVIAIKWKDKRDVTLLPTFDTVDVVELKTATGNKIRPKVVADCNHTMGGVDKMDQSLANYPVPRKRTKNNTSK